MGEPVNQSQGESEVESRTSEAGAPRKYREDKYGQVPAPSQILSHGESKHTRLKICIDLLGAWAWFG